MNEKKSVLELARGAIMERADYEMPGVIENIRDPNTSATAIRKITMTLSFKPDETRQNIAYSVKVETKLAPTNPVNTTLYDTGEDVVEMVPQIPGQFGMDGREQEAPSALKLVKFG